MNNHYTFPPSNPYETRYEKNYQQIEQDTAIIQDVPNTIRPEHIILGMIAFALMVWLIWPRGGSQGSSLAAGAHVTGMSVAEMAEMLMG